MPRSEKTPGGDSTLQHEATFSVLGLRPSLRPWEACGGLRCLLSVLTGAWCPSASGNAQYAEGHYLYFT